MAKEYKLTLDQMLDLSRKISNENWREASSVSIPEDILSEDLERHLVRNIPMYEGFLTTVGKTTLDKSHTFKVGILVAPQNLTQTGIIYVDCDHADIGAKLALEPSQEFEKIKERYEEISYLFSNKAKRKAGYEAALKLLKGEQ